jgi:homoserine trans-succinylase
LTRQEPTRHEYISDKRDSPCASGRSSHQQGAPKHLYVAVHDLVVQRPHRRHIDGAQDENSAELTFYAVLQEPDGHDLRIMKAIDTNSVYLACHGAA